MDDIAGGQATVPFERVFGVYFQSFGAWQREQFEAVLDAIRKAAAETPPASEGGSETQLEGDAAASATCPDQKEADRYLLLCHLVCLQQAIVLVSVVLLDVQRARLAGWTVSTPRKHDASLVLL